MNKKKQQIFPTMLLIFSLLFLLTTGNDLGIKVFLLIVCVLAGEFLTAKLQGKNVEIEVRGEKTGEKNKPLKVQIDWMNRGTLPIFLAKTYIKVENHISGEISLVEQVFSLAGKGVEVKEYTLREEYCGGVEITAEEIQVSGILGFFPQRRKVYGKGKVIVSPSIIEIPLEQGTWETHNLDSYRYSGEKPGDDPSETFEIREYRQGDSLKSIHWKLSGKLGTIMIKEASFPVEKNVLLLLDKTMERGESVDPTLRSRATEVFLSLSYALAKDEINHYLGWFDYRKKQFYTIRVDGEKDLWAAMEYLLESPYGEDEETTIYHLLETEEVGSYAQYVYVSEKGKNVERLKTYGPVDIYRPTDFLEG